MLKRLKKDSHHILEYIGDDYSKCLYLYLDYIKYGVNNSNIKIWIQENENSCITSIILMYYTGMHIFSKNKDCDYNEIKELIIKENPSPICAEKDIIVALTNMGLDYKQEYGWVRVLDKIEFSTDSFDVYKAKENDLEELTKLIYRDNDINNSYTFDDLYKQILARNKEKYGRNYIIKKDGIIVSHAGTGAENDKVSVLNYVMTDPLYRGQGLATKVVGKLCFDLIKEGKKIYLVNYTEESTRLYDKLGFKVCCEIGKLY